MDDQFKDGFERMLSDMEEPPTWARVSTQQVEGGIPARRGRGLLVAAGAFALTLIVVGSVVVLGNGDSSPVAAEMVDYVKIEWSQDLKLLCEGLDIEDNGGFSESTIEIWGPNSDGLLVLLATAPDGTTESQVIEYDSRIGVTQRVWVPGTSAASGDIDYRSIYRNASCVVEQDGNSSGWSVSDPPILTLNFLYGLFIDLPAEKRSGDAWSVEDLTGIGAVAASDQWRGYPVDVYARSTTEPDVYPEFTSERTSEVEFWLDPQAERLERQLYRHGDDVLGRFSTTVDVVDRKRVAASSVSFSTVGMDLVHDRSLYEESDDEAVTTTSLTVAPEETMAYYTYLNWLNQVGLNQDDLTEWAKRLELMCAAAYTPATSEVTMNDLATEFIEMDAGHSVRDDGGLPTVEQATDSLWISVGDPRACPERLTDPSAVIDDVDLSRANTVQATEDQLDAVRAARASFSDIIEKLNEMTAEHQDILAAGSISEQEQSIRDSLLRYSLQMKSEIDDAERRAGALEVALEARLVELRDLEANQPPVVTLGVAPVIYSRTGDVRLHGYVDQPVQVFVLDHEVVTSSDPSGRTAFVGDFSLTGEGAHSIWVTASNARDQVTTVPITVIVDPNLEVVFGYILDLGSSGGDASLMVYDRAEWFTGDEALAAAIADGVVPEGGSLDTDFYIRNPEEAHPSSAGVAVDTFVALQACWPDGGPCMVVETVDLAGFETLLSDPSSAIDEYGWHWYGDGTLPFLLTLDNGVVVQIEEQYLP